MNCPPSNPDENCSFSFYQISNSSNKDVKGQHYPSLVERTNIKVKTYPLLVMPQFNEASTFHFEDCWMDHKSKANGLHNKKCVDTYIEYLLTFFNRLGQIKSLGFYIRTGHDGWTSWRAHEYVCMSMDIWGRKEQRPPQQEVIRIRISWAPTPTRKRGRDVASSPNILCLLLRFCFLLVFLGLWCCSLFLSLMPRSS